MDNQLVAEFEAALNRLVGQSCWSVQISGVGSLVSFNIGEKIRRDQPMLHPDFKISIRTFLPGRIHPYVE
jgi:hypothetical protein